MNPRFILIVLLLAGLAGLGCSQDLSTSALGPGSPNPPAPLKEVAGSFVATVDPLAGSVELSIPPDGSASAKALSSGPSNPLEMTATLPDGSQVALRLWAQVRSLDDGSALVDVVVENLDTALTVPGLALVVGSLDAGMSLTNADAMDVGRTALHVGSIAPRGMAFASAAITGAGTDVFSLNISLTVSQQRPDASCDAGDGSVEVGGTLSFDGQASAPSSGGVLSYSWTIFSKPEGSAAAPSDPAAGTTQIVTDAAGLYKVGLTVKEGEAESRTAVCAGFAGPNPAPRVRIDAPTSVVLGERVIVDGSGSFDPLGDPLTYSWDFVHQPGGKGPGDLGGAEFEDSTATVTAFTAMAKGLYVVRLTVSDGVHEVRHAVVIRSGLDPRCACGMPIERVSVSSEGVQGNNASALFNGSSSLGSVLSADGCLVTFHSMASNLVSGDTNFNLLANPPNLGADIFVRNRIENTTIRVNVRPDGTEANGFSAIPSISADGKFISFTSSASNLVDGDTNYYRDPVTGATTVGSDVFLANADGSGVVERDSVRSDGTEAAANSGTGVLAPNATFVAFVSDSTDMDPMANDPNGNVPDLFYHDRRSGSTFCITCPSNPTIGGGAAPVNLTADGRYVLFSSTALWVGSGTDQIGDIYLWDRETDEIKWAGSSTGIIPNARSLRGGISLDGRFIAFDSLASNLVEGDTNDAMDVFLVDRLTGTIIRVTTTGSNTGNTFNSISGDGRYVVFSDSTQVYIYDQASGSTMTASQSSSGSPGNGGSLPANISADGRYVAFPSDATNLVPGDTNGKRDVFVAPNPLYDCEAQ